MKNIQLFNENKIELKKQIADFLNYIDVSDNSVYTYKVGLKNFVEYLKERNITIPTREDIIEYREHLLNTLKPTTANSYLIAVRNLYNYLEFQGLTRNITKNIKGVNVGNEHKRESLTKEQCLQVLNNAKDIREKVLFLLATTCGIRANELVNIRLEDFKVKQDKVCLYLLGKARNYKQDFVVVSEEVFELIKEYIKLYHITDYLFTSTSNHNNNGKLTTKTIRLIIKNMFKRIGLDGDEYSCHSCRHSFATLSIENGNDIREVSQALRHKSIQTTMIYLHDLERINNKCSKTVSNMLFN